MKTISILVLLLVISQSAIAKKTWEKKPADWSIQDCQKVQEFSPWCSESYLPLSGDSHYLIKAQWVSPVIVCSEVREEQLEAGESLEFMKAHYNEKLKQEGIDKNKIIKFRVYPKKGLGMVGQNLRDLYLGDPFFEGLSEKISLIKNKKRDDSLSPLEFKPLGSTLSDGFEVSFQNDGFISQRTWRADLLIESEAGEFKFIFEPRKMRPFELKLKN